MEYNDALAKAKTFIDNEFQTIKKVVDLEDSWVFVGGSRIAGEILMDSTKIRIYKESGKIEFFHIPPMENLHLLKKGKIIYKMEA